MSDVNESAERTMSIEEFDLRFDDGEDMGSHIDWSKARRIGRLDQKLDMSVPAWMFDGLHEEAARRGVSADALLKMWLADRLDAAQAAQARIIGHAAE